MGADEVVRLVTLLEARDVAVWLDGGWGVDALLERQTREHDDLDLVVSLASFPALLLALRRAGYAEIQRTGEKRFGPGDVLAMMPDAIHSVVNPTDAVTVSLHTYGMHLNYTGRSEFDPEKNTVGPIQRKVRRAD